MQAFEGIKILDCTHVLAGPFSTYQFALLGADVVKVEDPKDPDQARLNSVDKTLKSALMGTSFLAQGSNKRALALDLKTKDGQEVFKRLATKWADVIVENYRPGALKALGLGYDALSKLNPKLIYTSMSAFGQEGPRGPHTAYDPVISASSGITAVTGTEDSGPLKSGAPLIDYGTGMISAFAIATALYQRLRTGEGQHIDLAMFDTALIMQSSPMTSYLQSGNLLKRGHREPYASASAYPAKEGIIQINASNKGQQRRFYKALGLKDFVGRSLDEHKANYTEERDAVARKILEKTADEWENYLQGKHVPAARVRTTAEALTDPHLKSRGVLHRLEELPGFDKKPLDVPLAPFKFAHDGPSVQSPPPRIGQHTDEMLKIAGYSADEIAGLRKTGVVA